jgi:hypothetical protein
MAVAGVLARRLNSDVRHVRLLSLQAGLLCYPGACRERVFAARERVALGLLFPLAARTISLPSGPARWLAMA